MKIPALYKENRMDNMEIYKQLATPPKDALKTIGGGRLKNMTDIKPQWRIEKMTEVFGPCGIGWYPEITKQWTEEGCDGQKLSFCNINLYIKIDNEWSKPIPGTGGNMLTTKEAKGLYSSDEAYKMAFTDALSVAMKMIGMAADIYRGAGIDSKYAHSDDNTPPNITNTTPQPKPSGFSLAAAHKALDESALSADEKANLKKQLDSKAPDLQKAFYEGCVANRIRQASPKAAMVQKSMGEEAFQDDDIPFGNELPLM